MKHIYKSFSRPLFLILCVLTISAAQIVAQVKIGDNLGNHKATTDLNMNNNSIINANGMVIGDAVFTQNNVILDIKSADKALVIPRLTDVNTLSTPGLVNGMVAYDQATARFMVVENNKWSAFGAFRLEDSKILIGGSSGMATPVNFTGDVTMDRTGKAIIGNEKVLLNMLNADPDTDRDKIFTTNDTGVPTLINKSDIAISKYSTAERDAKYPSGSPAPGDTFIYNTSLRVLQVYSLNVPGWVTVGAVSSRSLPVVSTGVVTNSSATTQVKVAGNVAYDGGVPVTSRGVVYSTATAPALDNFKAVAGTGGLGLMEVTLTGLIANTKYYARTYATNSSGTSYGNEITFTSAAAMLPKLTTNPITDITGYNASGGGVLSDDGGASITARGLVWSRAANPVTGIAGKTSFDGTGMGSFNSTLTGIEAGKTYHVRAYATNSIGTGYGEDITFTAATASIPVVDYTKEAVKNGYSVLAGGSVTSDGGSLITSKGLAWNTSASFPTLNTNNSIDLGDSNIGVFDAYLNSLQPNTLFYVWAYATNAIGTAYADPVNFTSNGFPQLNPTSADGTTATEITLKSSISKDGGISIIERGFLYCRTLDGIPSIGATGTIRLIKDAGTGIFTAVVKNLVPGVTYNVRSYAITAVGGPFYGSVSVFNTRTNEVLNYNTPGSYQWTVPAGVTAITVSLTGANGGTVNGQTGGVGAVVNGELTVTPGDLLYLNVGRNGYNGNAYPSTSVGQGGFNGGGTGGNYQAGSAAGAFTGAGGGGATDIRLNGATLALRVAVAGGGGGAAPVAKGGNGGAAGADGNNSYPSFLTSRGKGGATNAGGAGGNYTTPVGVNGALGVGGNAANSTGYQYGAGGGGGGYYGGGGGTAGGSGGGGSSYKGGLSNSSFEVNANNGPGITITY